MWNPSNFITSQSSIKFQTLLNYIKPKSPKFHFSPLILKIHIIALNLRIDTSEITHYNIFTNERCISIILLSIKN